MEHAVGGAAAGTLVRPVEQRPIPRDEVVGVDEPVPVLGGVRVTSAEVDRALDAIALLATTSGRAAATATYTQGPTAPGRRG
jgi:hypothetical protein